ncbi:MAG: hypothetical protein HWN65_11005 [Candidatus Helarchaeota archaeon]|nr:hypothetical protein [Candidatus Helarchaeota archaeon]
MGRKPLSKVKELKKYERKIDGSEIPPILDLEKVNPIHKEIDAILRPLWENLHPVVQDFVTAWNESWNDLLNTNEDLNSQLRQKTNLISNLKANFEDKLRELNSSISTLKTDVIAKETELTQKGQLISDFKATDKESKLGVSQLSEKLEIRLKELNEQMAERQKKYEETQMQVGQSFQQKVLELDSEIMSLNEQLTERESKINELQGQMAPMQKDSQRAKFFEDKAARLEIKLEKFAKLLNIEEEEDIIGENG